MWCSPKQSKARFSSTHVVPVAVKPSSTASRSSSPLTRTVSSSVSGTGAALTASDSSSSAAVAAASPALGALPPKKPRTASTRALTAFLRAMAAWRWMSRSVSSRGTTSLFVMTWVKYRVHPQRRTLVLSAELPTRGAPKVTQLTRSWNVGRSSSRARIVTSVASAPPSECPVKTMRFPSDRMLRIIDVVSDIRSFTSSSWKPSCRR
mmetsp:Transcript_10219/g.31559  ORF Transcript_10219/g.31559 Transcript_10219/m.31559 type:complete len:207 (+) Transcript_10219:321-941(+)